MKKTNLILATIFATTAFTSCANNNNQGNEQDNIAVEANLEEKPTDSATPATMDERLAVVDLHNDDVLRPGRPVERLTVLDFNATWCGPCHRFAPAFHEAAELYGQKVDFISIDVDENPITATAFKVKSIPSVGFLSPDGTCKTYVGLQDLLPAQKFFELIKASL